MKPRWNIRIDWFVDDQRVLHGVSEFDADQACPEVRAFFVARALQETNRKGMAALARIADTWEWRQTTITLISDQRTRSITVKDTKMAMSESEATECTERIMEWLDANETTELLTA